MKLLRKVEIQNGDSQRFFYGHNTHEAYLPIYTHTQDKAYLT